MAKLTVQSLSKNPWFYIALIIVIALFAQFNSQYHYLGAAVSPSGGPSIAVTSVTSLSGQALAPGSTVKVSAVVTNQGSTSADFFVEHRILAAKNYPGMMSAVSVDNAHPNEQDSVVTQKVTGLAAGASQTLLFNAPVPTTESVVGGKSNVDTSYVQIVGAYSAAGQGYLNGGKAVVVNAGVLVNAAAAGPTGSSALAPQSCNVNGDCNGYLAGVVCTGTGGICVQSPPSTSPGFDWTEFYNNNKLLVIAGVIVLSILILSLAFGETKP